MRPYYDEDGVTIYNGDCRDVLPGVHGGFCWADPPYNVGKDYGVWNDALSDDEYLAFCREWMTLAEAARSPRVVPRFSSRGYGLVIRNRVDRVLDSHRRPTDPHEASRRCGERALRGLRGRSRL